MSAGLKRRWWRVAVAAVVGGAVTAGGWLASDGLALGQQPIRYPLAKSSPPRPKDKDRDATRDPARDAATAPVKDDSTSATWTRAASPLAPDAPGTPAPKVEVMGAVTPASAALPPVPAAVVPAAAAPTVPTPATPAVVPAVPVVVPAAAPVTSSPLIPAAPVLPVVPEFRAVSTPLPTPPSAETSTPKPADDKTPAPVAPLALPPLPTGTTPPPVVPLPVPPAAAPVEPPAAKDTKPAPVVPPLPDVPPPPLPSKSAEPVKPMLPAGPDFNLRPPVSGNTVKVDGPATAPPPKPVEAPAPKAADPAPAAVETLPPPVAAPVPTVPAQGMPSVPPVTGVPAAEVPAPARSADRPKAPETAAGTTDKDVFPVPPPAPPRPSASAAAGTLTGVTRPSAVTGTAPRENPMNLKQAAVAAVIGGGLAFAPPAKALPLPVPAPAAVKPVATTPVAADPPAGTGKTTDEKLNEILKKLNDLSDKVDGKREDAGNVSPIDRGLVRQMRDVTDELDRLKNQMKDLRTENDRLKAQVEDLKKNPSTSLRPTTGTDAMAGKGTVRVVNEYPVEITIVVNSTSHRVAPSSKLDITVPAGDFTYQLLSAGANLTPTKSPIKEKEVVTLRIK